MDIAKSGFWIGVLLAVFCRAAVRLERQIKGYSPYGWGTAGNLGYDE